MSVVTVVDERVCTSAHAYSMRVCVCVYSCGYAYYTLIKYMGLKMSVLVKVCSAPI